MKRKKSSSRLLVNECTEDLDEEASRAKKKMRGSKPSSHVSVHVDVINMKNSKKTKKIVYDEDSSEYEESEYEESTESDEEQIQLIKKRKGKKIVSNKKKKGDSDLAVVKKNVKNDVGNKKQKKKEKVYESENRYDSDEHGKDLQGMVNGLQTRMSASKLKSIVEQCTNAQNRALEEMGFGHYRGQFNFHSTPTTLGLWVCKHYDSKSNTLVLSNQRKIKVTRELIHDILGIPMGDKKVVHLRETTTEDPTTVKWRASLPLSVYEPDGPPNKRKIFIGKLENYLVAMSEGDWEFKVGFLVVFFSIFAHGNKDGSVNQRFLPSLVDINEVPNFDWCSYCLECMQAELKMFSESSSFSGPLLLLVVSSQNLFAYLRFHHNFRFSASLIIFTASQYIQSHSFKFLTHFIYDAVDFTMSCSRFNINFFFDFNV